MLLQIIQGEHALIKLDAELRIRRAQRAVNALNINGLCAVEMRHIAIVIALGNKAGLVYPLPELARAVIPVGVQHLPVLRVKVPDHFAVQKIGVLAGRLDDIHLHALAPKLLQALCASRPLERGCGQGLH